MKNQINKTYLFKIYKKYFNEIRTLTYRIRQDYSNFRKYRATFSDFDGEILYCLVRERKPNVVYEISPDCGFSSIYITSALSKNNKGKLFSFEIEKKKFNIDTQKLIENNIKDYRYKNHEIIIGDVVKTSKSYANPDMVLIDSCHDAWFAKWYIKQLFPRINDIAFIQDITFYDRVEYSGESKVLMKHLKNKNYMSLGIIERLENFKKINNFFPKRRSFESNSIIFSPKIKVEKILPNTKDILNNNFFNLRINNNRIYEIENKLEQFPQRQNIHRTYLRLSKIKDKGFYLKKAIGFAIAQLHFNSKPFNETLFFLLLNLNLIFMLRMLAFHPASVFVLLKNVFTQLKYRIYKKNKI